MRNISIRNTVSGAATFHTNDVTYISELPTYILELPTEILCNISKRLKNKDAISFASTCVGLFNLRFGDNGPGLLHAHWWRRAPRPEEKINTLIGFLPGRNGADPENVEIRGQQKVPYITTLTLKFLEPLQDWEWTEVILRMHTLKKLDTLCIDCASLNKNKIRLIFDVIVKVGSPLKKLTLVNLSDDDTTHTIFTDIRQFNLLETLELEGFQGKTLSDEIGNLRNLKNLIISSNLLTFISFRIMDLINLEKLHIVGDSLTTIPAGIDKLFDLQELMIVGDYLTSLPNETGNLINLKFLEIGGESLGTFPPGLDSLINLQTLRIKTGFLRRLPPEIWRLTNLKELGIRGSCLREFPIELTNLTNLELLDIVGTDFLNRIPTTIGDLINLKSLCIRGGTDFTSLPTEIGKLINLENLYIVGDLKKVPDTILNLVNLRRLTIEGNNFVFTPIIKKLDNLPILIVKKWFKGGTAKIRLNFTEPLANESLYTASQLISKYKVIELRINCTSLREKDIVLLLQSLDKSLEKLVLINLPYFLPHSFFEKIVDSFPSLKTFSKTFAVLPISSSAAISLESEKKISSATSFQSNRTTYHQELSNLIEQHQRQNITAVCTVFFPPIKILVLGTIIYYALKLILNNATLLRNTVPLVILISALFSFRNTYVKKCDDFEKQKSIIAKKQLILSK